MAYDLLRLPGPRNRTSHRSSLQPQDRQSEIGRQEGMVLEREFPVILVSVEVLGIGWQERAKALNRGGLGLENNLWALG